MFEEYNLIETVVPCMDERERAEKSLLSGGEIVRKGGGCHKKSLIKLLQNKL